MEKPIPMEIYRHFKGGKYQIVCIAENTETGKEEVIYRAMYEPFKIYARDLDMFTSLVDREKYPDVLQKYRFELYTGEEQKEEKIETPVKPEKPAVQSDSRPDADKSGISPALLKFLDAEGPEAQLECLTEIKDELTPEILTPIEFSIGMDEAGSGSVLDRYRNIKTHIMLKQRYEKAHR